jgi:hypothetical protein
MIAEYKQLSKAHTDVISSFLFFFFSSFLFWIVVTIVENAAKYEFYFSSAEKAEKIYYDQQIQA